MCTAGIPRMDRVQSQDMDEALKKPLVDLDVVESAGADAEHGAANTFTDEALKELASPSNDGDEESDVSADEWETDSLYEEALHFVRDDQLSSGEYLGRLPYIIVLQLLICFSSQYRTRVHLKKPLPIASACMRLERLNLWKRRSGKRQSPQRSSSRLLALFHLHSSKMPLMKHIIHCWAL